MARVAAITETNMDRSYSMDYKRRRTANRGFYVQFDDPVRAGLEAAISVGINFGDIYRSQAASTDGTWEYDSGLIAVSFDAKPVTDDSLTFWRVVWSYESHLDQQGDPALWTTDPTAAASTSGGGGANESPELEPTKFYWGKRERKWALHKPVDDPSNSFDKFQNSAYTPYTRVPEVDNGLLTLTITKNLILPDPPAAFREYKSYWDTTNADPFFGFVIPGSVKCDSITGESAFRNNVTYYAMTFAFSIDEALLWDWRPVDKGPDYWTGLVRLRAVDDTGHPNEVYLDGTGGKLAEADPPVLNQFRIYERKLFHPLGLE